MPRIAIGFKKICFDANQFEIVINIGHASTVPFSPLRCPSIFWSLSYYAYLLISFIFFSSHSFFIFFLFTFLSLVLFETLLRQKVCGEGLEPPKPRCYVGPTMIFMS